MLTTSSLSLANNENVEAFSCVGLKPRKGNDAACCRVLDESARGADGPVIGDSDEYDAKLFAFVEKCLVVVGL